MNPWYWPWVRAGKPYRAARPIGEVVARLKEARPEADRRNLFGSIGDLAHLTAVRPKDHTPYSQTGWPDPSPYGIGFATDIMHRPDLDLDCFLIFEHWITEARAGRLPWLKYLIWRAKIYHVRNGWEAADATGHFDHIHVSARTDHVHTSIGDFNPLGDDMDTTGAVAAHYRLLSLMTLDPAHAASKLVAEQGRLNSVPLIDLLKRVDFATAQIGPLTRLVQTLTDIVNAGGGDVDTAALIATIERRAEEEIARDEATAAELAELREQLAAAADREADAARAVLGSVDDASPANT